VAQPSQRLPACRSRRAGADRLAVSVFIHGGVLPASLQAFQFSATKSCAQAGVAQPIDSNGMGGVHKARHRHRALRQGNQPHHAAPVADLLNAMTIPPLVQTLPGEPDFHFASGCWLKRLSTQPPTKRPDTGTLVCAVRKVLEWGERRVGATSHDVLNVVGGDQAGST
jgi:hypothetical protein